jgi:hypothetical protein
MSLRGPRPDVELTAATSGLKEFQKRTARTVVEAMFERGQRRFLVADEVGLGKTKIARYVVAETIRRLWDDADVDRIDIVYICSNGQIARQNVTDLNVLSDVPTRAADRITMLPAALAHLSRTPVNLVAFTPGTSLNFGHAGGQARERAMLFHILSHERALGPSVMSRLGARSLLSLGARSFDSALPEAQRVPITAELARGYHRVLKRRDLVEEVEYWSDGRHRMDPTEQRRLVGRLRRALAESCIDLLTPDLIILDEFQRFTTVLDGVGDDGELARMLFERPSARVLLLSATPYRMLTGVGDDESHAEGFSRTLSFLLGKERANELDEVRDGLTRLRHGLVGERDLVRLATTRDRVQTTLRSVMVRTERLAATQDRSGMLDVSRDIRCPVTPDDVSAYVGTDKVTQTLDNIPTIVEYWKSAPYLVNFMDHYKVKDAIRTGWREQEPDLVAALRGDHMLEWEDIDRYRKVDSRNPRARWLIEDLAADRAFERLWVPPTLPQTSLRGAYAGAESFTKRLIFSGWAVAPKAVAGLVSFEYERRNHRAGMTYRNAHRVTGRLTLPALSRSASERFTTLALLLPCRRLAELGDPLAAARETEDAVLPLDVMTLRRRVAERIADELGPLTQNATSTGRSLNIWYAASQAYLDRGLLDLQPTDWRDEERESRGLVDHLEALHQGMESPEDWGPPPEDLPWRLADLAIAGPAVAAFRALHRIAPRLGVEPDDPVLHTGAAKIAWAFLSFFNDAENTALVAPRSRDGDYWSHVAEHCRDGALGSVLDEWLHLVPDQLRLDATSPQPMTEVVDAVSRVLRLKDGSMQTDYFDLRDEEGLPRTEELRTHFAMRFGQARGETAEGDNPVDVRRAFNSPFRPFVLVSTSVGQEGLDFHYYAHAVVHWNLPGNPVDLEQREGRVHRYKNHAVRKNLGSAFIGSRALAESPDPWSTLFRLGDDGLGGMVPEWIFTGPAAIQRLVPLLPMSRDIGRLQELVKATTVYRMTIGQPRQAELVEVLAGLPQDEQDALRQAVTIDLSPTGQHDHFTTSVFERTTNGETAIVTE